jgi:tRNA (guanine37-N1)-methyltransferase
MRLRFDVVTLFADLFAPVLSQGVIRRAFTSAEQPDAPIDLRFHNPRDFSEGNYRRVDDRPFGGGPGMVMLAEPLALAIEAALAAGASQNVIYLSPQGERLTDALVGELGRQGGMTLLCGRYEGVDQRLIDAKVTRQVSVGDYVLSGGELPAMVLIDALVRRIPGALNTEASSCEESFATGMLDWPHYTRPPTWRGKAVPDVLMGGNHATINTWRQNEARRITLRDRPDLIDQ